MQTLTLLAAALVLVGLLVGTWGWRIYRRQGALHADARTRWVQTSGTVVDSRILERERTDSNDNSCIYYEPRIRYAYSAGGAALESDRFALCNQPSFTAPARAEEWLRAHAPGAAIDLWYDPERPGDSACILDKPNLLGTIVTVSVGVGLAAFGAMILSYGF